MKRIIIKNAFSKAHKSTTKIAKHKNNKEYKQQKEQIISCVIY